MIAYVEPLEGRAHVHTQTCRMCGNTLHVRGGMILDHQCPTIWTVLKNGETLEPEEAVKSKPERKRDGKYGPQWGAKA
jgi:hypothetical protein